MWHDFANGNDDRDEAAEANLIETHKIPQQKKFCSFIQLLFYTSYDGVKIVKYRNGFDGFANTPNV